MKKLIAAFAIVSGLVFLSLPACRIEINAPPGGNVTTESGNYECQAGEVCSIDVYDVFFDETFVATPKSGFHFINWKEKHKGFCGGSDQPCRLSTTEFTKFEVLMEILESEEVFYLEPVFAQPNTWYQLGEDIRDEEKLEATGRSVSLSADGNLLAVSAFSFGLPTSNVRVYSWTDAAWRQLGDKIDGDGLSVSLSANGHTLAIGYPYSNDKGHSRGEVRVFQWSGSAWQQIGDAIRGSRDSGLFGHSVSLSADGKQLAVGAPEYEYPLPSPGYVRVYAYTSPTEGWQQLGSQLVGEGNHDQFGYSVSISADGKRLAVGAPKKYWYRSGLVRVYKWSGADWLKMDVDLDGDEQADRFGFAVSLSADGGRLAVGAATEPLDYPSDLLPTGYVRVLSWTGSAWKQLGDDIVAEIPREHIGISVSLSSDGDRLAFGARSAFSHEGHVYAYKYLPQGENWSPVLRGLNMSELYKVSFNYVSLSADGKRLAAGAWNSDGYVRVFTMLLPVP